MAQQLSFITRWSQYLAARLAAMGLTFFDVEDNLHTAAAMGRLLCRVDRRHRERTAHNLRLSFPELTQPQIEDLTEKTFEHLVQLAVEVLYAPRLIHADSWSGHVRIGDLDGAVELLNSDQPVILVTGHFGNWEAMGYLMALAGYPVDAIARPIDNPLINDWLLGIRQRRGLRIITKWDATDQMLQVLETGGLLGFIADQNAGDRGLFVPFFGRLASTYKSIGLLAISRKVPIICGYARRFPPHLRYELGTTDIIYPDQWANEPDPLYYVTSRYMRAIEKMIKICPEQYLWMHRRWKSRPRHERLNKPMPASLQRRLESLPWINQPTLNRLMHPAV